jgi:N-carbamoylputrescine amidase
MKITVCELPNERKAFENAWARLCEHCQKTQSEFILLPEMPFEIWLPATPDESDAKWSAAISAHDRWFERLPELGVEVVAGSRPALIDNKRYNVGFVWTEADGVMDIHAKHYLPEEPGFWEATWYDRGPKEFRSFQTPKGKIGFLICSELWFNRHARDYGLDGVQIILSPRATESRTADKWVMGGRVVSVVSGAYCLSSNWAWNSVDSAVGWIIEPENGEVLGLTSAAQPFLTLDIDLDRADQAKSSYPRYVLD